MTKTTFSAVKLFAALAGVLTATVVAAPVGPSDQPPETIPVAIQRTIAQARSAQAQGKHAAAAELFEQAAEHGEYVEAEVGEVRARLWAGQFRHAVAISNVVAGEHPESAEAQALLAYIEDRSGYTAQALQRLQREREVHPHETALIAAEAEILTDRHRARDAITQLDQWMSVNAPRPDICRMRARASLVSHVEAGSPADPTTGACAGVAAESPMSAAMSGWPEAATRTPPTGSGVPVVAGNGLIIDGGRRVITLSYGVDSPSPSASASIWVRNARGELRRAKVEMSDGDVSRGGASASITTNRVPATAVPTILSLNAPFATDQSLPPESIAPQNVRGLCFALAFPASISMDAMLPAVTPCFAFDPHAADEGLRINIPLSTGERGTPVFDAQGRLIGLADPAAGSPTKVVRTGKPFTPSTDPRPSHAAASAQATASAAHGTQPTIAMPELYERLAPSVVQVITMEQP